MAMSVLNPAGLLTVPGYTLQPNGGLTFYVHSSFASLDRLPAGLQDLCFTSINSAFAACRANRGDVIKVLEGHTESVTGADGWSSIKAGVRVIGQGNETERPTITWTAAGSQLDLDVANVSIQNMRMFLAGAHAAGSA